MVHHIPDDHTIAAIVDTRVVVDIEIAISLNAQGLLRFPEYIVMNAYFQAAKVDTHGHTINVVYPIVMNLRMPLRPCRHIDSGAIGVVQPSVEDVIMGYIRPHRFIHPVQIRHDED